MQTNVSAFILPILYGDAIGIFIKKWYWFSNGCFQIRYINWLGLSRNSRRGSAKALPLVYIPLHYGYSTSRRERREVRRGSLSIYDFALWYIPELRFQQKENLTEK